MFDKKDVIEVASLSRLRIEEKEHGKIIDKFNDMIQFVDKIKSADVSKVEKQSHQKINKNIVRKDEIKKGIDIKKVEELAPKFSSGHIVVPAVIE